MNNGKPFLISLTGVDSHKIKIPDGQGSFSIGTKGISQGKFDAIVDAGAKVNWPVFQESQFESTYAWPRFFYYSGNDCSFAQWSIDRRIETFSWRPYEDVVLDASECNISRLHIHSFGNKVHLQLGTKVRELCLSGDLEAFIFTGICALQRLTYSLHSDSTVNAIHCLPTHSLFEKLQIIDIENSAIGKPFDCQSLLQFPNVEVLNLSGNLINLEVLSDLKHLNSIGIRNAPNLQGFPSLHTWSGLTSFIGWIVEEQGGKQLQKELKELLVKREMSYSNVSKLKKQNWFLTEYTLPFKGWEGKNEKAATKKYKETLKKVAKVQTEDQVEILFQDFIQFFNTLEDIETIEREDIGEAVALLAKASKRIVTDEQANLWFDTYRDY